MNGSKKLPRKVPVRVEPKTYFANERTFLSWINMSVTLGSISSALTVFGDNESASGAGIHTYSLSLCLARARSLSTHFSSLCPHCLR